jgi:hypothetical protein
MFVTQHGLVFQDLSAFGSTSGPRHTASAQGNRAAAQRRAEAAAFVAERGPDVAARVKNYCDTHGHGPLWSDLGRALGLAYQCGGTVMVSVVP